MVKKVFILITGNLLLAPCAIAICCDNLLIVSIAMVYGVLLWNSPKFSTRIRKFWFEFWRMNIKVQKKLEVR